VNRIFPPFAAFALCFMGATLILGLSLGDVRNPDDRTTQRWATVHRLSGVAAALVVVLVDSVVITYFVGTSRWCKEVVDTYRLDQNFTRRMTQIKRRTFPISVMSMLAVVGVVALGGAADPAASMQLQPFGGLTWATLHLLGATAGLIFIAYASVMQWNQIVANRVVIDDVMAAVHAVRKARGLDLAQV